MMRNEFEKLTGIYPDNTLYRCIEEEDAFDNLRRRLDARFDLGY